MNIEIRRPGWARLCARLATLFIVAAVHLTRWVADSESHATTIVADLASDTAIEIAPDISTGLRHIRNFLPKPTVQAPDHKEARHGSV